MKTPLSPLFIVIPAFAGLDPEDGRDPGAACWVPGRSRIGSGIARDDAMEG